MVAHPITDMFAANDIIDGMREDNRPKKIDSIRMFLSRHYRNGGYSAEDAGLVAFSIDSEFYESLPVRPVVADIIGTKDVKILELAEMAYNIARVARTHKLSPDNIVEQYVQSAANIMRKGEWEGASSTGFEDFKSATFKTNDNTSFTGKEILAEAAKLSKNSALKSGPKTPGGVGQTSHGRV